VSVLRIYMDNVWFEARWNRRPVKSMPGHRRWCLALGILAPRVSVGVSSGRGLPGVESSRFRVGGSFGERRFWQGPTAHL